MGINLRNLNMSNGRNHTMFILNRNTSLRASITRMCHTTKHRQSMSTTTDIMNPMYSHPTHIMSIMLLQPQQPRFLY
jgi:hypothetical protein